MSVTDTSSALIPMQEDCLLLFCDLICCFRPFQQKPLSPLRTRLSLALRRCQNQMYCQKAFYNYFNPSSGNPCCLSAVFCEYLLYSSRFGLLPYFSTKTLLTYYLVLFYHIISPFRSTSNTRTSFRRCRPVLHLACFRFQSMYKKCGLTVCFINL